MIANPNKLDYPQSPLSLLRISGKDAEIFLQGQLTNDLARLNQADRNHQWSALCNHQGRAITTFIVWQQDSDYLLLCQSDVVSIAQRHLMKYILRSDVTIETAGVTAWLSHLSADQDNDYPSIMLRPEVYLVIKMEEIVTTNTIHSAHASSLVNESRWQQLVVDHHLPIIGRALSGELIPNHFDFDEVDGISYNKGCYTGQEIIARLHHLAQPQYGRYHLQSPTPLSSGDLIYATETYGDQPIGHIMASYGQDMTFLSLACIKHKAADQALSDKSAAYLSTDREGKQSISVSHIS